MIQKHVAIIAVIVIILLLGTTVTAIKQRNLKIENTEDNVVKLNGSIIAEVSDKYLGAVFPSLNLSDNYVLEVNVSKISNDAYQVDSVVKIPVEVVNNVTKQYLLGRYLTTFIFIVRKNNDALLEGKLIDKILRALGRFNVFSEGEKFVEIPLSYETIDTTENASLYIFALGSLTGVLARDKPVFARKVIDLEFLYNVSDIIDVTPPVTMCILEGEK